MYIKILIFVLEKNDVCSRNLSLVLPTKHITEDSNLWTTFFVSQVVKFKFPSNISDITTAANTSIGLRQEDPALGIFKCWQNNNCNVDIWYSFKRYPKNPQENTLNLFLQRITSQSNCGSLMTMSHRQRSGFPFLRLHGKLKF